MTKNKGKQCSVDECEADAFCKGMCSPHYWRFKRYGTTELEQIHGESDEDKFFKRFTMGTPDECWEFGPRGSHGYGTMTLTGRRTVLAHRFSYEHFVGPIPDGLQLDHLCRNRPCVNPAHLEAVTQAENLRREHEARSAA